MTKEAIKQALQYIEANAETQDEHEIAEGLRQIIAEADKQNEPVAWGMEKDGLIFDVICPDEHKRKEGSYTIPLYTTSQRTWVGLMEEEIREILVKFYAYNPRLVSFAQEIQAKLKKKNT